MTSQDIQKLKDIALKLSKLKLLKDESSKRKKFLLNDEREMIMLPVLNEDKECVLLMKENEELLLNRKTKFKLASEGSDFLGTHAIKLSGAINNNGFLYLNNVKNMFPFPGISNAFYPKSFHGEISWAGKSTIKAGKTGISLVGSRIPSILEGAIGRNGSVNVKTTQSDFEWTGYGYIERIICDPFNGDERKRSKYLSNRLTLYKKMIELEQKIIS